MALVRRALVDQCQHAAAKRLCSADRGIRWRVLGTIIIGWLATPLLAGIICFLGLFFLQNVFNQAVV